MRLIAAICFCALMLGSTAGAAGGRVSKVLPQFLDDKGRHSLSPSLYDRDAYQAFLQRNPEKRSGIRFAVQWKGGARSGQLKLRVELRGAAETGLPKSTVLEQPVKPRALFSGWNYFTLAGDDYKAFGEVTAWRATLWSGDSMLAEQKSFLWGN